MSDRKFEWDASCASAWGKWFHVIESGAQILSDRMVEMAGIEPGHRVLDIATGLGEPAITAARAVGPKGSVFAIDLSPDMLVLARDRAASLNLTNVEFQEMNAEQLALPDQSLDAALCRWGVMFMRDLPSVMAAVRRCLAPGGRFAAAVWGPADDVPGVGLGARVVHDHLGLPPPDEGALTPFAFSDVDALHEVFTTAGFADVSGEWVTVEFAFDSPDAFTQFRRERSGPLLKTMADFPEDAQEAAWQAVTEAVRRYAAPDGAVRTMNQAYCVIGRK